MPDLTYNIPHQQRPHIESSGESNPLDMCLVLTNWTVIKTLIIIIKQATSSQFWGFKYRRRLCWGWYHEQMQLMWSKLQWRMVKTPWYCGPNHGGGPFLKPWWQQENNVCVCGEALVTYSRGAMQRDRDRTRGSTSSWGRTCCSRRRECTRTSHPASPSPSCSAESLFSALVGSSSSVMARHSCTDCRSSSCPWPGPWKQTRAAKEWPSWWLRFFF